jgi:hypothetical protein
MSGLFSTCFFVSATSRCLVCQSVWNYRDGRDQYRTAAQPAAGFYREVADGPGLIVEIELIYGSKSPSVARIVKPCRSFAFLSIFLSSEQLKHAAAKTTRTHSGRDLGGTAPGSDRPTVIWSNTVSRRRSAQKRSHSSSVATHLLFFIDLKMSFRNMRPKKSEIYNGFVILLQQIQIEMSEPYTSPIFNQLTMLQRRRQPAGNHHGSQRRRGSHGAKSRQRKRPRP